MKPRAYYNEIDPHAAAWIRELIKRGLVMDGEVDTRSIADVEPSDLRPFVRCHFFAGIGLWDLSLRIAGWPEDRPVWTGSCPCQPFSVAGKGKGVEDERHLWPVFAKLIRECQPASVFGEQVASAQGRDWLAGVFADLEGMGYQRAGADLCAAGVGAPHIRQRLYWVADSEHNRDGGRPREIREEVSGGEAEIPRERNGAKSGADGPSDRRLVYAGSPRLEGHAGDGDDRSEPGRVDPVEDGPASEAGAVGGVGDTPSRGLGIVGDATQPGSGGHADSSGNDCRLGESNSTGFVSREPTSETAGHGGPPISNGGWNDAYWHPCRDGKLRRVPVEPELFPLADAGIYVVPGMARRRTVRPALLRGSGNAIVPEVAAEFITAFLDATEP